MSRSRTFVKPLACAGLLLGGLIMALVSDGWGDAAGCVAIILALSLAGISGLQTTT